MAIKKIKLPNNSTVDINDARLPDVTSSDNGNVLAVSSGAWAKSGLKTINNNSLLGTGNITIQGGGSVGTLNTTATTSQSTSSSESFSGTIKLHKISKTGDYDDLIDKPITYDGNSNMYVGEAQGINNAVIGASNNIVHDTGGSYETVLDTGNYSSYALPLSGGTMAGNIILPPDYYIKAASNNGNIIGYDSGDINLHVGDSGEGGDVIIGAGGSVYHDNGSTEQLMLDTGNYSSYALPLAGGTMTGDIKMTDGEYINASNGYAMCGQNGSGTFYSGPGYSVSSAFLIRSGNINLTHRKHTSNSAYTDYKIYDASNITISSSEPTSSQGENGDIWIKI